MTRHRLITLGRYPTEIEAELVRSVLERNGIECYLSNCAAATALSYIGSAVGGAEIRVYESDIDAAQSLIETTEGGGDDNTAWFCTACEETQGPSFDECWKCGQDREQVGIALPESRLDDPNIAHDSQSSKFQAEKQLIGDDIVRAWRLSLFGLVTLPFILHLYSTFILIAVALSGEPMPRQAKRMFWGAAVIDVTAILLFVLILRRL